MIRIGKYTNEFIAEVVELPLQRVLELAEQEKNNPRMRGYLDEARMEGRKEVAAELLKEGMSPEQVSRIAKLPQSVVSTLCK